MKKNDEKKRKEKEKKGIIF